MFHDVETYLSDANEVIAVKMTQTALEYNQIYESQMNLLDLLIRNWKPKMNFRLLSGN